MALLNEKFLEVKGLIQTHPFQAKNECDNGVAQCSNLKGELENIKGKLIEKFGEDELFYDLESAINNYLE